MGREIAVEGVKCCGKGKLLWDGEVVEEGETIMKEEAVTEEETGM